MNRPRRITLVAVAVLIIPAMGSGPLTGPQEPGPRAAEPLVLVGDGRADDTEALQRAVDEATGPVRLPRGTYRITRPITIELDEVGFTSLVGDGTAQIIMNGPGPAFRFVGTHDGSAAPRTFKANVWDRQRTPMIDALEIVGAHLLAALGHVEAIGLGIGTLDHHRRRPSLGPGLLPGTGAGRQQQRAGEQARERKQAQRSRHGIPGAMVARSVVTALPRKPCGSA